MSENGAVEVQNYIKRLMQENARQNIFPKIDLKIENDIEDYYALLFLSNALFGVLQDWINHRQKETQDEIVSIMPD